MSTIELHEITKIFSGNTFKTERLDHISNYSFTDTTVSITDDVKSEIPHSKYFIYSDGDNYYLNTELPIFGVKDMLIKVEKIKDVYIIITLFSKDNNVHLITLEQTLQ